MFQWYIMNLIMYYVNFGFLKSLELTNDHFEILKKKNFDLEATIWATIDINIIFFIIWFIKYIFSMFCLKFNKFSWS
jgi:hypothetical protein